MKFFRSLSFSTQLICVIVMILLTVTTVNDIPFLRGCRKDTMELMGQKAAAAEQQTNASNSISGAIEQINTFSRESTAGG